MPALLHQPCQLGNKIGTGGDCIEQIDLHVVCTNAGVQAVTVDHLDLGLGLGYAQRAQAGDEQAGATQAQCPDRLVVEAQPQQ